MKPPSLTPIVPSKPERALHALSSFFRDYSTSDQEPGTGEAEVLQLFHQVRTQVPAYSKFLERNAVNPDGIQSMRHFRELPVTNKSNYHQAFALPELCRFGRLEDCDMLAVSSGSTGEPTIWPRFLTDEVATLRRFEQVLVEGFEADTKRTLAVVGFALGSWVGGMYTTSACRQLAAKGYPITVVTPGNNFSEILRIIPKLAPLYKQIVLLGYPPFLKDVIDRGTAAGIPWSDYSVKLVMAGEVFSESWRDLVARRLGQAEPARATASLYGTADAGVLANETPASVLVRRALAQKPELVQELFGQARLPTLCQYDPRYRFFEQHHGQLLFSGDGGIPLVRYNILDHGGVIPYREMYEFLRTREILDERLHAELHRFKLPFVYIFGRNNFAVSYYGANVFPENVASGLEQPHVESSVTGKFVLEVIEDDHHNSRLQVTTELAPGGIADERLASQLASAIEENLVRVNSEFAHYVPKERRAVLVRLLSHGDASYFPLGVKHRYTR